VAGKGLDELVNRFNTQPLPTPLAVLNLVEAIGNNVPDWERFALIDMGGATTDFYSFCEAYNPDSGTVLKGIVEPKGKRTVEGDLGMRVSAGAAFDTAKDFLMQSLEDSQSGYTDMQAYVERLSANTSYLPVDLAEQQYDRLLAAACLNHALIRHAGTIEEVMTTKGPVMAQTGKDLRRVNRIIGSGGFLAAMGRAGDILELPAPKPVDSERVHLLPENFEYYADTEYVLPLLGCLASEFPRQSAASAIQYLTRMHHQEQVKEFSYREFTHT
jgi:uncharacterized protein (TIGR01319 family)